MKKELLKKVREEIIKEVLPIDEHLATLENLTLDDNVCEFLKEANISFENLTRGDIKRRNNIIEKVLSDNKEEIRRDNTGNLYVLLNNSNDVELRYYNVETGDVRTIIDNDVEYKFIKENLVIYLEDYFDEVDEKEFRKQAQKIRCEYFDMATKYNLDDTKYLLLRKYRKKDR